MTVSRDAVIWGYRFFLGRDPESEDAIVGHLIAKDELRLAERLIRSPEFAAKRRFAGAWRSLNRLERLSNVVEMNATAEQFAACLRKIEAAWVHLGQVKPHFSVLTHPQFLPNNLDSSIGSFWSSGLDEADRASELYRRHTGGSSCDRTCVEFGCGVGRVTMGLARHFGIVHGYDISSAHLKVAQEREREVGVSNVVFHECSSGILAELEACDFFFSCIVFQHNPPPVIKELICLALRSLKENGIAIFQVPTYIAGYRFNLNEWLSTDYGLDMEMHCIPQAVVFEAIRDQGGVVLEVLEDNSTGSGKMISNVFTVRKLPSVQI